MDPHVFISHTNLLTLAPNRYYKTPSSILHTTQSTVVEQTDIMTITQGLYKIWPMEIEDTSLLQISEIYKVSFGTKMLIEFYIDTNHECDIITNNRHVTICSKYTKIELDNLKNLIFTISSTSYPLQIFSGYILITNTELYPTPNGYLTCKNNRVNANCNGLYYNGGKIFFQKGSYYKIQFNNILCVNILEICITSQSFRRKYYYSQTNSCHLIFYSLYTEYYTIDTNFIHSLFVEVINYGRLYKVPPSQIHNDAFFRTISIFEKGGNDIIDAYFLFESSYKMQIDYHVSRKKIGSCTIVDKPYSCASYSSEFQIENPTHFLHSYNDIFCTEGYIWIYDFPKYIENPFGYCCYDNVISNNIRYVNNRLTITSKRYYKLIIDLDQHQEVCIYDNKGEHYYHFANTTQAYIIYNCDTPTDIKCNFPFRIVNIPTQIVCDIGISKDYSLYRIDKNHLVLIDGKKIKMPSTVRIEVCLQFECTGSQDIHFLWIQISHKLIKPVSPNNLYGCGVTTLNFVDNITYTSFDEDFKYMATTKTTFISGYVLVYKSTLHYT